MFYFKKKVNDKYCLYSSAKPPKNLEGLTAITEEEYSSLLEELNEEEK